MASFWHNDDVIITVCVRWTRVFILNGPNSLFCRIRPASAPDGRCGIFVKVDTLRDGQCFVSNGYITMVTSHGRWHVSNNQLNCLFNSLFRVATAKQASKLITDRCLATGRILTKWDADTLGPVRCRYSTQDCGTPIANAPEIPQHCNIPSIHCITIKKHVFPLIRYGPICKGSSFRVPRSKDTFQLLPYMAIRRTAVSPILKHRGYHSIVLNHRCTASFSKNMSMG